MPSVTSRGESTPFRLPATGSIPEFAIADSDLRTSMHRTAELQLLVRAASAHEQQSATSGQLWGRIGELYTALRYGVRLCRKCAQGHDGRLGNDLVEIKTITPKKRKLCVRAKRSGNFSLLAVVRVLPDQRFDVRIVRRDRLPKYGEGKYLVLSWSRACALAEPIGCRGEPYERHAVTSETGGSSSGSPHVTNCGLVTPPEESAAGHGEIPAVGPCCVNFPR